MLIDYDTFDTIQTTLIIALFAGGLALIAFAFFLKRVAFAPIGAALIPLAGAAIVLPDFFATPVFEAVAGANGPKIGRAFLIGHTTYTFANGKPVEIATRPGLAQLVLNDTKTRLVIMPVEYTENGIVFGVPKPAAHIAPYSAFYTKLFIQDYGKGEHRPPPATQGVAVDIRYWLTWD